MRLICSICGGKVGENHWTTRLGVAEYTCLECKAKRWVKYKDDYRQVIDMEVEDGQGKQAETCG